MHTTSRCGSRVSSCAKAHLDLLTQGGDERRTPVVLSLETIQIVLQVGADKLLLGQLVEHLGLGGCDAACSPARATSGDTRACTASTQKQRCPARLATASRRGRTQLVGRSQAGTGTRRKYNTLGPSLATAVRAMACSLLSSSLKIRTDWSASLCMASTLLTMVSTRTCSASIIFVHRSMTSSTHSPVLASLL